MSAAAFLAATAAQRAAIAGRNREGATAPVDLSQTVPCDVCEGRCTVQTAATRDDGRGNRTETVIPTPCPRCRGTGRRLATSDPMAAPHVDVSVPAFGGSIRLRSASGGLEALWIDVRDPDGERVVLDAFGNAFAPAVRITPRDARALSDLLRRYADTHRESEE